MPSVPGTFSQLTRLSLVALVAPPGRVGGGGGGTGIPPTPVCGVGGGFGGKGTPPGVESVEVSGTPLDAPNFIAPMDNVRLHVSQMEKPHQRKTLTNYYLQYFFQTLEQLLLMNLSQ